jgi:hypothetical protein
VPRRRGGRRGGRPADESSPPLWTVRRSPPERVSSKKSWTSPAAMVTVSCFRCGVDSPAEDHPLTRP